MDFMLSMSFLCLAVVLAVMVSVKLTTYFLRTKEETTRRFDDVWRTTDSLNRLLDEKENSLFHLIMEKEKDIHQRLDGVERNIGEELASVRQELIKEIGSVARAAKK